MRDPECAPSVPLAVVRPQSRTGSVPSFPVLIETLLPPGVEWNPVYRVSDAAIEIIWLLVRSSVSVLEIQYASPS